MAKITLYTQAYNVENYIKQCIQSVLSQTFSDFEWLLVENGSTDNTRQIINQYVGKDNRVHLIYLDENKIKIIDEIVEKYASGEYISIIDADDWIEPTYLEDMIKEMDKGIDLVCVSVNIYSEINNKNTLQIANVDANLEQIANSFGHIHWFLRHQWGNIMRIDMYRKLQLGETFSICLSARYGGDTARMIEILSMCKNVMILPKPLYNYRIRKGSISTYYNNERYKADIALYWQSYDFLKGFGEISPENHRFIHAVFYNAIHDTINTCVKSNLSYVEKCEEVARILSNPQVLEIRKNGFYEENYELMYEIVNAFYEAKLINDNPVLMCKMAMIIDPVIFENIDSVVIQPFKDFKKVYKLLIGFKYQEACELLFSSQNEPNEFMLRCVQQAYPKHEDKVSFYLSLIENKINTSKKVNLLAIALMEYHPLLKNIEYNENMLKYAHLLRMLANKDIDKAFEEADILLDSQECKEKVWIAKQMQLVAALTNDANGYIYFTKQLAIQQIVNKSEKATETVSDLIEMLPDDPEVKDILALLKGSK